MDANNDKNSNINRIEKCLESLLYPSLVRVLDDAYKSDAINYSHKFRQIFMNRLVEDLWKNNPLHPERKNSNICNMPFSTFSSDQLRPPRTFSWGMSRNQAAIIIQVI
jgi:hypothetical protein